MATTSTTKEQTKPIHVMFCCNDHRNGSPTGRVSAINLGEALGLECVVLGGEPTYSHGGDSVRIGRKSFPAKSYSEWVGNWCWDAAWMTPEAVADLLAHVQGLHWREHRKFAAQHGYTPLFDKWLAGERITAEELTEALQDE